jgi:hypothetical protein
VPGSTHSSAPRHTDLSRTRFSAPAGVWHTWTQRAGAGRAVANGSTTMTRQFFWGMFITLAFVAVVTAGLLGIFTLVSYIAGPVGG